MTQPNFLSTLKRNRLWMGLILTAVGVSYQIFNASKWGWWIVGEINPAQGPTVQQTFALDLGFLWIPLFIASILAVAAGVTLWLTDKNK